MPIAFVLINTEMGSEAEVLKSLQKIKDVKEVYTVYGIYDIIAKIEAESMDRLKDVVFWNVRRLNQVRSTQTLMIAEEIP